MKRIYQVIILLLLVWFAVFQVNAVQEAGSLTTTLGEQTFVINEPMEFTFTTIPEAAEGMLVLGTFEFGDPDAIAKLEYLESKNGQWYEFYGDFGPPGGFPFLNATSRFRVTFQKGGIYTVTASMIKADGSREVVCSTQAQVKVGPKEPARADFADVRLDVSRVLRMTEKGTLFIIGDGGCLKLSTQKNGIRAYDEQGNFIGGGESIQELSFSEAVTVTKIELYYQDEKEFYEDWHPVPMEKLRVSVDREKPVDLILEPQVASNEYGYYHEDVAFNAGAADAGEYSGIGKVEYWITRDEEFKGESTVLYEYKAGEEILNAYEDSERLVVSADLYNSENVKVFLRVIDRAGNEAVKEYDLKMNVTSPELLADISGTESPEAMKGYYQTARTLTITVKDRADTFDQKAVARGFLMKKNGEITPVDSEEIVWNSEGDVHTGSYVFQEDGHYEWELSYINKAGLSNQGMTVPEDKNIAAFTVDQSAPEEVDIRVEEQSILAGEEEKGTCVFYDCPVTVKLSAKDHVSKIQRLEYRKVTAGASAEEWKPYPEEGILLSPEECAVIEVKATDNAGNIAVVHSAQIIVDEQEPAAEIVPEPPNENGFYSRDVQIALKAEDSGSGISSGIRTITYRIAAKDTGEEENGVLFDRKNKIEGAVFDSDGLAKSWSGELTVDSVKFNSNHVIAELTVMDNAGNIKKVSTKDGAIRIDVTKPRILVSYDNQKVSCGKYFKAERTAVIVITERNFKPENVEIFLENKDGEIPELSEWKRQEGTGNGDNTTWTASVKFSADGEYRFEIAYQDPAGWSCQRDEVDYGGSMAPKEFVIDLTAPKIKVEYDNYDALNQNYYKKSRTATITIHERNLEPDGADRERIHLVVTAVDGGIKKELPIVSRWRTDGAVHTATIHYKEDAFYTFEIAVEDKAGNASENFPAEGFFIDQTQPVVEIGGVENHSANNGDVVLAVTYSDQNYDAEQVRITLTGANRKRIAAKGVFQEIPNGGIWTFEDFAKIKEVDDIYTLQAAVTDKAGNTAKQICTFSVNRFGSAYGCDEETAKLNGTYTNKPGNVVIYETNTDELEIIRIMMFQNDKTVLLRAGKDYFIDVEGGNGSWYRYIYTIPAKNFEKEGVYRLAVFSEDAAGNVAENTLETKDFEIGFGIDRTAPNIMVANLENNVTYAVDRMQVRMQVKDNFLLNSVKVYLDNYEKPYKVWTSDSVSNILEGEGEFSFEITGESLGAHRLKIEAFDTAGNVQVKEITGFYITTNLWVRYYNNHFLFFGSIAVGIGCVGILIFTVIRKRRKGQGLKLCP